MRSAEDAGVAATIRPWPHEPTIAHIVLLDFGMVPTVGLVEGWIAEAFSDPTVERVRTSALLPAARSPFEQASFDVVDRLALLQRDIAPSPALPREAGPGRLVRLGRRQLTDAAELDRAAFPSTWRNDESSLDAIRRATPQHRGRLAIVDGRAAGFSITGRSGSTGYLQRFAVHPDLRRRGVARQLVSDALRWLQRRGATTAMVNTGLDNAAALALYERAGFARRPGDLVVMERAR